jgi:hypothetical protein
VSTGGHHKRTVLQTRPCSRLPHMKEQLCIMKGEEISQMPMYNILHTMQHKLARARRKSFLSFS